MLRFVVCVVLASFAAGTWGQGYPMAAELQAQLGQPFVVENRPGANGIVGADGDKRHPAAPEVPTTTGAGVKYYYDGGWFGIFAQAKTPADFHKFVASELKAYGEMVRLAGVKPE